MAEINKISPKPPPIDQSVDKASSKQSTQNTSTGQSNVGRGNIGQPVGLPTSEPTTQNALMNNVITGRDASQTAAAEQMRSTGGHSATDVLLGLNKQPTMLGVLLAPPGNLETLRHMSPAMRRKILRDLLNKQRGQIRNFVTMLNDSRRNNQENSDEDQSENETETPAQLRSANSDSLELYNQRSVKELEAATLMLDLLDEFLGMQDYTLSQMGTFAQG